MKKTEKDGVFMAFRILNDEEISLLNDNQREHYENELDMYQQRAAFVEQLELLENADIQPYEPQLRSITVMGEIEKRTFTTPEYIVSACAPASKPELHVRPFEMAEPIDPTLPVFSKRPEVYVEHLTRVDVAPPKLPLISKPAAPAKNFQRTKIGQPSLPVAVKVDSVPISYTRPERAQSKMPTVVKPATPVKNFQRTKIGQPDLPVAAKVDSVSISYTRPERAQSKLPTVVKPATPMDFLFSPLNIDQQGIQTNLPNIAVPNINFNAFSFPEDTQHSLPEVTIHFADVKSYSKPEQSDIALPAVVKPNVNVKSFEKAKPIQINLPELSNITPVTSSFKRIEKTSPELPVVLKPSSSVGSFRKPKHAKPELPKTSKINLQPKNFSGFAAVSPDLPVVTKVTVTEKFFKAAKTPKSPVITLEPPKANVKSFKKVEVELTGLPDIGVISIPNAYEALKDFFPITDEASGEKEGAVS